MQYKTAFEVRPGEWQYATLSRRGGGPIGYCADHAPHATESEARECYSSYLRDAIRMDGHLADWTGCEAEGCDNPTKNYASTYGVSSACLCDGHNDRDMAIKVMGLDRPHGDVWGSI
jgi:hypothetical protein